MFLLPTTFIDPCLPESLMVDAVSSLSTAIIRSLKCGLICNCSFNVAVRRDVFNSLFKNCGSKVCRRPGKFFNRCDFSNIYFSDNDFTYSNEHNECVSVLFPIYMYSHLKFIKLTNTRIDFVENIYVRLMKKRS